LRPKITRTCKSSITSGQLQPPDMERRSCGPARQVRATRA
jgi:hypothetical protein